MSVWGSVRVVGLKRKSHTSQFQASHAFDFCSSLITRERKCLELSWCCGSSIQQHRSSRRVLPKVGHLGFRPSTFLALGITVLPASWRALVRGCRWFSLNRNGILSRALAWNESTRRGKLGDGFGVSTVIQCAVLEMEARLFRKFKRLHFTSSADTIATNSWALNLLCEQYKTFEKHLLAFWTEMIV